MTSVSWQHVDHSAAYHLLLNVTSFIFQYFSLKVFSSCWLNNWINKNWTNNQLRRKTAKQEIWFTVTVIQLRLHIRNFDLNQVKFELCVCEQLQDKLVSSLMIQSAVILMWLYDKD